MMSNLDFVNLEYSISAGVVSTKDAAVLMVWPAETASQPGVVLDPCSQFQVQLSESFGVWPSGIGVPQTRRDGAHVTTAYESCKDQD